MFFDSIVMYLLFQKILIQFQLYPIPAFLGAYTWQITVKALTLNGVKIKTLSGNPYLKICKSDIIQLFPNTLLWVTMFIKVHFFQTEVQTQSSMQIKNIGLLGSWTISYHLSLETVVIFIMQKSHFFLKMPASME